MDEILNLLPPGASVTAVIVVVVLFLRHVTAAEERCAARQKEAHAAYQESLQLVIEQDKEGRAQFSGKLDELCTVTRSMESAVQRMVGATERRRG